MLKIIIQFMLIFGTFINVYSMDEQWIYFQANPNGSNSRKHITDIAFGKNGMIYFGSYFGIDIFDGQSWQHFDNTNTTIQSDTSWQIRATCLDSNKNLWCTTSTFILNYDGVLWNIIDTSICKYFSDLHGIIYDNKNNIWVDNGIALNKITDDSVYSYIYKKIGLPSPHDYERSILSDKFGNIWYVAGNTSSSAPIGIVKFNEESQIFYDDTNLPVIGEFNVSSTGKLILANNTQIAIQKSDNEWKIFDSTNSKYTGGNSDFVTNVVEDDFGNIWIGAISDLWNPTGTQISYLINISNADNLDTIRLPFVGEADNLHSPLIKVIKPDDEGNIWIGTYNDGIFKYKPSPNAVYEEFINTRNSVSLYPNPSNYSVFISDYLSHYSELKLINSFGLEIKIPNNWIKENINNYELDVSSLSNGLYFIVFKENDRLYSLPFVKLK
ncbi:MAG: T9SS type A sorting domain-containing protein [Bacteroidetes bacterium]|nr:MAG: T9SS type A sorting domain-containing protein [Bacteroidota bacterium]